MQGQEIDTPDRDWACHVEPANVAHVIGLLRRRYSGRRVTVGRFRRDDATNPVEVMEGWGLPEVERLLTSGHAGAPPPYVRFCGDECEVHRTLSGGGVEVYAIAVA